MALMAGLPGALLSCIFLWRAEYGAAVGLTLSLLVLLCWCGISFALRNRVVRSLQTIQNMLAALREGDFSVRARGAVPFDALGEVLLELNALGEILREQRLSALEAVALLRIVMAKIEVAIFTFDQDGRLRLVNHAGEKLLDQPAERLLGLTADELGLTDCMRGEPTRTVQRAFPGGTGRWGIQCNTFREQGLTAQLLVISDLGRALREEERQAWQSLIRVLGHELNNSLASIKSISGSLESLLAKEPRPDDWSQDMQRGLSVISTRAEALNRFMQAYARLARLPPPRLQPLDVGDFVHHVADLETRLKIKIRPGAALTIQADRAQLEQLLINLLRNAVDATLSEGGSVEVGWRKNGSYLELWVKDEGQGISNPANLFVPFFTTKPGGSGIGLVLSRQIAEAHGGTLTLENRQAGHGCKALLRLPL